MRLGLQLRRVYPGQYGNHFDTMLAIAQAAEAAGLDSLWMPDHTMFPDTAHPEKEVPVMECFVVLSATPHLPGVRCRTPCAPDAGTRAPFRVKGLTQPSLKDGARRDAPAEGERGVLMRGGEVLVVHSTQRRRGLVTEGGAPLLAVDSQAQ